MGAEAGLNKTMCKIMMRLLKIIPIIMAVLCFLNTTLFCFGISIDCLSFVGGASFLTLLFLYISSYVFKFCIYHRLCLHYVTVMNLISIIDMYVGIPVDTIGLFLVDSLIAVTFLCLILYYYNYECISEKAGCSDVACYC